MGRCSAPGGLRWQLVAPCAVHRGDKTTSYSRCPPAGHLHLLNPLYSRIGFTVDTGCRSVGQYSFGGLLSGTLGVAMRLSGQFTTSSFRSSGGFASTTRPPSIYRGMLEVRANMIQSSCQLSIESTSNNDVPRSNLWGKGSQLIQLLKIDDDG